MTLLAKTLAGSRLYRLDNEHSDIDEKGIFLPPVTDCLLDRAIPTASEKRPGYEYEAFSLQHFLHLAANAHDVAMIMLHSDKVLVDSPTYQYLRENRARFYTKGMSNSLGFVASQSVKYALRADRMETVEEAIMVLEAMEESGVARLGHAWDLLPDIAHTRKFDNPYDRSDDKRTYEIVGKRLPATITPAYALDILVKVRDSYGERVRNARAMGGRDLKSIVHAFRTGFQLRQVYTRGDFTFPLPETEFLRDVKTGRLNYVDDKIDEQLNTLITEVEALAAQSTYPERVDAVWLDSIVLRAYDGAIPLDTPAQSA